MKSNERKRKKMSIVNYEAIDKSNEHVIEEIDMFDILEESTQDVVNEPNHYKHGSFETIDEMIIVFGVENTIMFCRMNAWKYRARAPYKGKFEEDMKKANRYLEMARELEYNKYIFPDYNYCLLKEKVKEEKHEHE